MKIAIAGGHSAKARGAAGYLDEYDCDRAFVAYLVPALRNAGFEVLDCSNEEPTESGELRAKVDAANRWDADVFMDVHFNAGGGTGCECWYYGQSVEGRALATRLSGNVSAAMCIPDRGAKSSTGLYVLHATKMTAVLLETCFVDSKADRDAWALTSWEALTSAVVSAFEGITAPAEPVPAPAPAPQPAPAPAPSQTFGGRYRCTVEKLNVRDRPSLSGAVVASYGKGQTVALDNTYTIADGYVWGQYTAYSGHRRYIAVGKATGKPEPNDYLVRD